jgi:hypothetical protein
MAFIGVPTGAVSGLVVLDIDPRGAQWYEKNRQQLNPGRVHETPRGRHLVYAASEVEIRNSVSKVAPGVDVRGEGGYVIWWPAHGLGSDGELTRLTPFPRTLLDASIEPVQTERNIEGSPTVSEGSRNNYLSAEAYRLRKQGASIEQIDRILQAINAARCDPSLTPKEVSNIARGKAQIAPENPAVDLVLTRAADVEVEAIKWLWNGWLAAGKLHILAGRAGTGKTTVALAVAATITRGGRWPGQYAVFGPR